MSTQHSYRSKWLNFRFTNHLVILSMLLALVFTTASSNPPPIRAQGNLKTEVGLAGRAFTDLRSASNLLTQTGGPLLNITAIAAGDEHACALTTSGGVKCWGSNYFGQLGDGTTTDRFSPVDVSGLTSGISAIAAGGFHTCALTTSGGVKCWGDNWSGQLGDGTTTDHHTPVEVSGLSSGVSAIANGSYHTCALTTSGGIKCWGNNEFGQLGNGTTDQSNTPVDVSGLVSNVSAITTGAHHTCARMDIGRVKCWGNNGWGQLGDGTFTGRYTPVNVSELGRGVSAIDAGLYYTCALTTSGGVKCWGNNQYGQLGDGTTHTRNKPVQVSGLNSGVSSLAAGGWHTCARMSLGGAKCWGDNSYGQLGDGTFNGHYTPVDVSGLGSGVSTIDTGYYYTCALTTPGGVKCWGDNKRGQLGDGTIIQRSIPMDVSLPGSDASDISTGWFYTCALTASGGVKCWGENSIGQLGDGTTIDRYTPVDVIGLGSGVSAVAAGVSHTCALTASGGVKCWGGNWFGELGDGTTDYHYTPVEVSGLSSGVSAISVGLEHTCALTASGGVKCWGGNWVGQLGDGTTDARYTPVDVSGLESGVSAIATGGEHTCALTTSGGVKCWGYNMYGELGDGTTTDRHTPVDVSGLGSGVSAIATFMRHTCALTNSGGVKCWGDNGSGQLGDGTTDQSNTPVEVSGLGSGVGGIVTGGSHTCALTTSGGVKCWGANEYGELGDGTTTDRYLPVDVSGLGSNVSTIAGGGDHTCALVAGSKIKCWGRDNIGQLGLGSITKRLTPVDVVALPLVSLIINYPSGAPGSFFTLTGVGFSASDQATLRINDHVLTTTLEINPTGGFIFFLDTSSADAGYYRISVEGVISASASFFLHPFTAVHSQEGGGTTFVVPPGITLPYTNTLIPLVHR